MTNLRWYGMMNLSLCVSALVAKDFYDFHETVRRVLWESILEQTASGEKQM